MSVSMTRGDGVTVLTVTSDGDPVSCPLICQVLCVLCYCPGVAKRPPHQYRSQSVLGALQIMVGILNLGLGLISCNLIDCYGGYPPSHPAWFGVLFIIGGITSILSERFSSSCKVVLSVILNLCTAASALKTLIQYSTQASMIYDGPYSCKSSEDSYWYHRHTTTPSPAIQQRCFEAQALTFTLQMSVCALLITLSCLELCVAISSATLNIKALREARE